MYVLDTNVLSEVRRPDRAHPNVVRWLTPLPATQLAISAISILELEQGVLRMERRDARQGAILRAWLTNLAAQFAQRILPIDEVVARRCAQLHVPNPMPERDAFIAATALVHGRTLVTRSVTDFARTGVTLLNPWN